MANSGIIYSAYGNHSRFYLAWQLAGQDIANNRSLINWQAGLEIQPGGWWWGSNAVKIYSINIDGSGSLGGGTWSNISGTGAHQLTSGSIWIGHAADGSKAFSASLSGWLYGEGNRSASGSWSVPTIPRNSQVTTNASNYTLGNPITIYTNRKSSSFSHTITIRMDNGSGTVLQTINSVGGSVTWTPTPTQITTMQNHIPNSNRLTLHINQYNNQVKASSSVSVTLNLTDANPTFTDFTFADTDATTVGITGNDQVLVKGKSVLQVDISAANKMAAIKGASENHYSIAYDGASELENYSADSTVSASFSDIATIGNRTIQVTAYDSRNNATKVSKDVTVYDYAAPTIITSLTRENNFDSDTTVHIEGTYTPLVIGGTAKNSLQADTLQYRYQEEGGSFGSWITVAFTDNGDGTYSVSDFVVALDNTKKYNFEFHIDDSFGTVTTTNSVDVGTPILFVGQNNGEAAVSINGMPATGAKLSIDGANFLELVYPVGSIYMSVDNTNPGTLFGGTWEEWGSGRVPVGVDVAQSEFDDVEKTGGEKTHTLTVNEMPAHTHSGTNGALIGQNNGGGGLIGSGSTRVHWTVNLSSAGGGQPHNNLQPYITCYMWKRTA